MQSGDSCDDTQEIHRNSLSRFFHSWLQVAGGSGIAVELSEETKLLDHSPIQRNLVGQVEAWQASSL